MNVVFIDIKWVMIINIYENFNFCFFKHIRQRKIII